MLARHQLEDYTSQLPLQLDVTREEVLCGNSEAVPLGEASELGTTIPVLSLLSPPFWDVDRMAGTTGDSG